MKFKILSILTALLFSAVIGSVLSTTIDVNQLTVTGVLFALSFIPLGVQGALMITFANMEWADGTENMGGLQVIGYYAAISEIDNLPMLPSDPQSAAEEVTLESDIGLIELENEIRGLLRNFRGLKPKDKDDFAINRPEAITNSLEGVFESETGFEILK